MRLLENGGVGYCTEASFADSLYILSLFVPPSVCYSKLFTKMPSKGLNSLTSKVHLNLWNLQLKVALFLGIIPFYHSRRKGSLVFVQNPIFRYIWHFQIVGSTLLLLFNVTKLVYSLAFEDSFAKKCALTIASLCFARGSIYQLQLLVNKGQLVWFLNNADKFYRTAGTNFYT